MNMLRVLLTSIAVMALLVACGSDTSIRTFDGGPEPEPPESSSKDFGSYVLHFNGISTDQLQPEVAQEYSVTRSKNRALLTVSIIRKEAGTLGVSVPGEVTASANNLTGQRKNLNLRQVREGDAFYYIGDVSIANSETLVFNVNATPENAADNLEVRFLRQFYAD
jgi:hypothetical protein